jgi:hypothetical protein
VTEASAYVIEEIQGKMESAYSKLFNYLRKSSRAISAKKDLADYESDLEKTIKIFETTLKDFPDDEELKKASERFSSFY